MGRANGSEQSRRHSQIGTSLAEVEVSARNGYEMRQHKIKDYSAANLTTDPNLVMLVGLD